MGYLITCILVYLKLQNIDPRDHEIKEEMVLILIKFLKFFFRKEYKIFIKKYKKQKNLL